MDYRREPPEEHWKADSMEVYPDGEQPDQENDTEDLASGVP